MIFFFHTKNLFYSIHYPLCTAFPQNSYIPVNDEDIFYTGM